MATTWMPGPALNAGTTLLESEARIASYIAIARGEADRRHWRRLGRILTQKNGVCGPRLLDGDHV